MLNLNNTLIAGGNYRGDKLWNKEASSLDFCFKLYQIETGEAFLYSNNKEFRLQGGEVYFVNGFQIEKQCCPVSFQVNWIHFMSDSLLIKQMLQKLPAIVPISKSVFSNFDSIFKSFSDYFKNLPGSTNQKRQKYIAISLKIQSLLSICIADLFERFDMESIHAEKEDFRLLPALEYINDFYKKEIKLEKLASLCFLSENYFHALFKKKFSITPHNYVLQLRMNEALNLLSNTSLQIKEVARETGFYDAAYFSRTFAKMYKISPRQYRSSMESRIP
jgi:AraC-like DNA-binding protein